MASVVACLRAGAPAPAGADLLLDAAPPALSSTEIRRRAAGGEPLEGLVPPAVAAWIRSRGLYRG